MKNQKPDKPLEKRILNSSSRLPEKWDKEADVVIIGYGATGAVAAIEIADLGGKVIILEKSPEPGGSSSTATGGMRLIDDVHKTADYIKSLSFGSIDDETARIFAETWLEVKPWLEKYGTKLVQPLAINPVRSTSKPASFDAFFIKSNTGYTRSCGRDFFSFLDNIVKDLNIKVLLSTPAKRLVKSPETRDILGVIADHGGTEISVKARKAVIMACGGFAGDPGMLNDYIVESPVKMYPTGTPYCSGDGVRMAMGVGAALWHMNAIEWAPHAFKPDSMPAAFWLQPKAQSWIHVNSSGKRFRNESRSLAHSKFRPEMFECVTNSETGDAEWPNAVWYIIFDEKVRQAGPVVLTERVAGSPPFITYNNARELHMWSRDNRTEISIDWIKKADTIIQLAKNNGIDPPCLHDTVARYNEYCATTFDPDFGRKAETLIPIDKPPYYLMECVLGIINTQGGPRRNARSQVLNAIDGLSIPRLYAGGEFGSVWSFLYPGACNLPECIVSGLLSARNAMKEIPWT